MVGPIYLLVIILHLVVCLTVVDGHEILRHVHLVFRRHLVIVALRAELELLERRLLHLLILLIELIDDLDSRVSAAVECALQLATVVEVVRFAREE